MIFKFLQKLYDLAIRGRPLFFVWNFLKNTRRYFIKLNKKSQFYIFNY